MRSNGRFGRGAGTVTTLVVGALLVLVACEDSSSGISVVQAPFDAGSSVDGAVAEGGIGTTSSSGDSGPIVLPACAACMATKCQEELKECGSQCTDAALCVIKCGDDLPCQDRCLRRANDFNGNLFYGCVLAECAEPSLCNVAYERLKQTTTYGLAACTRYQQCNAGNFVYQYGTLQSCAIRNGRYLGWAQTTIDSDISATYLEQCAAATLAMSCEDFNSARFSWACQPRGPRLVGAECVDDAQCETGFCGQNDYRCAKCAIPPAVGEACIADRCAPGLVCLDGTCVAPVHYAGRCDAAHPCEGRSYCNAAGQCVSASQNVGDTCGVGGVECDFAAGYVCNGDTKKCIQFQVADEGVPCGFRAPGYVFCIGALCPSSGVCPAQREDGDPCDDVTGPSCLYPDQCIDGKCQKLPPANKECQ